MKRFLYLALILLFAATVHAATPNPGHDASRIGAGAFPAGDFSFNGSLRVLNTSNTTLFAINATTGAITIGADAGVQTITLNNDDITGVNAITIADPGTNEGLLFGGGNLWRLYESPNDLSNAAGNLQIVRGTTRVATFDTNNVFWTNGSINVSTGALYAPQICLNGDCETSWPDGGSNSGGWSNTSTLVSLYNTANNVSANTLFVDNTNGRVGVGTTSPTVRLHSISTAEQLRIGYNTTSYAAFTVASGGALTIQPTADLQLYTSAGSVVRAGTVSGDGGQLRVRSNSFDTAILGDSGSANDGYLALYANSSLNNVVIRANGTSYINGGNFGIGTTSPSAILHVNSSDGQVAKFERSSVNNWIGIDFSNSDAFIEFNVSGDSSWIVGSDNSNNAFTISNTETFFGTNDRFVIDSAGEVGIGTTAPNNTLHVVGSANITSTLFAGSTITGASGLTIQAGTVSLPSGQIQSSEIADSTIDEIDLNASNTPSAGQILAYNATSGGFYWTSDSSGSGNITGSGAANHVAYWTSGSALAYDNGEMYWDANNNRLGLGTSNPSYTFEISKNANNTNLSFVNLDGQTNAPDLRFSVGSDGSHNGAAINIIAFGRGTGTEDLRFETNNWGGSYTWALNSASGSPSTYKVISELTSSGSGAAGNSQHGRFSLYSVNDSQGGYSSGAGAGTINVRLAASGDSWFTGGEVGIGTAVPNVDLTVGTPSGNTANTIASFWEGDETVVKILSNANIAGNGSHLHLMENNGNLYGIDIWYDSGNNRLEIDGYQNSVKTDILSATSAGAVTLSNGLTVSAGTVDFPANSIPGDDISDNSVDTSELQDSAIMEVDLNASNTPSAGQILAYNSTSGGFYWTTDANGGSSSGGGWTNTTTQTSTSLNVSVDSGTLFVDSTNNRVGIGTSNPSTFALEVAGSIGPEADNTRDLGSASRRFANAYTTSLFATNVTTTGTHIENQGVYTRYVNWGGSPGVNTSGRWINVANFTISGTSNRHFTLNGEIVGATYHGSQTGDTQQVFVGVRKTSGGIDASSRRIYLSAPMSGTTDQYPFKNISLVLRNSTGSGDSTVAEFELWLQMGRNWITEPQIRLSWATNTGGSYTFLDGDAEHQASITAGYNTTYEANSYDNVRERLYFDSDSYLYRAGSGIIGASGGLTVASTLTASNGFVVSAGTVDFPANSVPGDDIADSSVDASELEDSGIMEVDLNATNSAVNGYVLTYNSTTGGFSWVPDSTGSANITGSGSANHIAYWTSGSNVGFDSSQLYWDANNNRLGIGTASPTQALHVTGSANVTQNIFYGGNLTGYGADFAERFTMAEEVKPADVVCLRDDGRIEKCRSRADTAVVGVVSTHATIIGNAGAPDSIPVGIVGIVPTRVKGPVKQSELLTTSPADGFAEKATSKDFGAIIGKAMESCSEKECTIKVLVGLR